MKKPIEPRCSVKIAKSGQWVGLGRLLSFPVNQSTSPCTSHGKVCTLYTPKNSIFEIYALKLVYTPNFNLIQSFLRFLDISGISRQTVVWRLLSFIFQCCTLKLVYISHFMFLAFALLELGILMMSAKTFSMKGRRVTCMVLKLSFLKSPPKFMSSHQSL